MNINMSRICAITQSQTLGKMEMEKKITINSSQGDSVEKRKVNSW